MTHSRRSFLRALGTGVVIIPLNAVGIQAQVAAADTPKLDPNDATAQALGYTHAAPNPSKICSSYKCTRAPAPLNGGAARYSPAKWSTPKVGVLRGALNYMT